MIYDLIILTDQRYLKDDKDPYKHNVFYEDNLLLNACEKLGLIVTRKAWDDPDINWSETRAIVFRSTWDYFDRFNEFNTWLKGVSSKTRLINSEILIRWNLDKHYLLELSKKSIHIPDTKFINRGYQGSLADLQLQLDWDKIVLKPCVSGAGRHTYLLEADTTDLYENTFKALIATEDMMMQQFQHHIVDQGEISMMVFNGNFTHAVLKKAKSGDFRVQDDFGGTVHDYKPNDSEIEFAIKAVNSCPELPTYARVDIFYDNNDKLALGELELVEPELWFRRFPHAAHILAHSLKERITN